MTRQVRFSAGMFFSLGRCTGGGSTPVRASYPAVARGCLWHFGAGRREGAVQNHPMQKIRIVAALALLAVIAFVTNPSPERHRAKVRQAIAERSPLAGALGIGALTAFVSTYHPLGVLSYTTVDGRVVSVGAFGYVHVRGA